MVATTTDNRKWKYWPFPAPSLLFELSAVVAVIWIQFYRALRSRKSQIYRCNFAEFLSVPEISISRFGGHFRLSVIIGIAQGHSLSSPWTKVQGFPLEFWWYLLYVWRHKYFRYHGWLYCDFRVPMRFKITVLEIAIVNSPKIAVGKKQIWRFSKQMLGALKRHVSHCA